MNLSVRNQLETINPGFPFCPPKMDRLYIRKPTAPTRIFFIAHRPGSEAVTQPARETAETNLVWETVKAQEPRGAYGGVFEYKYFVRDVSGNKLHVWGMILWDKIMIFIAHRDSEAPSQQDAAV